MDRFGAQVAKALADVFDAHGFASVAHTRRFHFTTGLGFQARPSKMPGYEVKHERIAIAGTDDLLIRSLLDRQQYSDPLGDAQRVGISSAAWPMFGLVWPSGLHLAARMALRPVSGERILEIGCGLALASLVGHRRGADITASDCHPQAANFLRENARLNDLPPLKYRHGHWSPD